MFSARAFIVLVAISGCLRPLIPVSPPPVSPPSGIELGFVAQEGHRLSVRLINALAQPVIVDLNQLALATPQGERPVQSAERMLMLSPGSTTVITLHVDVARLRRGDRVSLVFSRLLSSHGAVAVLPLMFIVN